MRARAAAFIRLHVRQHLRPLDVDTYCNGPMVILQTGARGTYIQDGEAVLWCNEWEPGLIIVRFDRSGEMSWAAFRDPRAHFAGRTALPDHTEDAIHEDDDPFYPLIFDGWDAQNGGDPDYYHARIEARPANRDEINLFGAAMGPVSRLKFEPPPHLSDEGKAWAARCKANIAAFAGDGIRIWNA